MGFNSGFKGLILVRYIAMIQNTCRNDSFSGALL